MPIPDGGPRPGRVRAVDVFRGLTVAAMIIVNCSGSDDVYSLLDHAPWHGLTFADFVFPAFLLLVGVSAALSSASRRARGQTSAAIAAGATKRALGLFVLGLLVNFVIYHEAGGIRWPGVLQRIALCSLGATIMILFDRPALEPWVVGGLLVIYWLLLTRVPVPGYGPGVLTPGGNLASWLDRKLMGGHLINPLEDQEGLLSTIPALATTLLGVIAGRRVLRDRVDARAALRLGAAGLGLAALGAAWSVWFPINKHLWTSSFALATGGGCLAMLAACLLACGERPARWLAPAESMGRHALGAYILSGFIYGIQEFVRVTLPDGKLGNLKLWTTASVFASWLPPRAASLSYALAFTTLSAAVALIADPP